MKPIAAFKAWRRDRQRTRAMWKVMSTPFIPPVGAKVTVTANLETKETSVTVTQQCPNCEGMGYRLLQISLAGQYARLPCNRCDCTGVIHG